MGERIDVAALREALFDVVKRHEALRTRISATAKNRHQEIFSPSPVKLDIRDFSAVPQALRTERAEALAQEIETETISAHEVPFLRAVLARFDERDAVLGLITHHLASDAFSMGVIIRDLANRYAVRTGHRVPDLPTAPQYREYVSWQREGAGSGTDAAREYWRRQLAGAQFTAIPTDIPRSAGLPETTAKHRFLVPGDVVSDIDRLARASRATSFMALAAMYQLLVHRLTGATDVVIATFTPGRGGQLFDEAVGSFFNFVPLRTNIAGCRSFRDLLERTRRTCLQAFSYEIPSLHIFAQAPELMRPTMADNATAAVFESIPAPNQPVDTPGDLQYAQITRLLSPRSLASAVPDGALWALNQDPSGDAIGAISYKRNLFREDTIATMATDFGEIARVFSSSPDTPLRLS